MNETQRWNPQDPIPGCMGRMINIFGSTAGMPGTKMLTDKPHPEGKRSPSPNRVIDDKPLTFETRSSSSPARRSGGTTTTPMKMLIAHEMSKESETKQKPPSVVARLMGLDTLPATKSTQSQCLKKSTQQDNYKDVYEVLPQRQPLSSERRMDLVRQKFMEAKRLATDQRLLQSKEFQEALEVLSSNRDLFLKFLEEPNSLFSQNLAAVAAPPPLPPPKRITVLKPSRSVDVCKNASFVVPQPTRIVVLKPSPKKAQDSDDSPIGGFSDSKREDLEGTRDAAKEITRQIRESLSGNRRDDNLLSSILSNGYIGDESSFNRSENEFLEDDAGNLSDSELVSPTSRFSWDHFNRFGSPVSLSSLSRASYSPESSVIREAKKRLSERWAMVASGGNIGEQQQRQVRRSSSTLGEMLSIPEKKEESDDAELGFASSSRDISDSPMKFLRSKSVPSSSSCSGAEKSVGSKDHDRPKNGRALFKGKVSSLFFYKSKKAMREREDSCCNARSIVPDDHDRREELSRRGERGEASISKPSPVTVLETGFDEELNSSSCQFSGGGAVLDRRQLISRSPPIESVARSLTRSQPKLSRSFSLAEEQQEHYSFLKSLLDSAGLGGDAAAPPLARWHSLESPLDPSLLDKLLERKDEDAKCRERRSNQRLLFDAVNSALLDIGSAAPGSVAEEVWRRVKNWWDPAAGENSGMAAEKVLKMEVAGGAWREMMSSEMEEIGKGIGRELLEELVGEALFELIHRMS